MLLRSIVFILVLQFFSCSNQASDSSVLVKTSRCPETLSFNIQNLTKKSSSEIYSEAASRDDADYASMTFYLEHMKYFSAELVLDQVVRSNCHYVQAEQEKIKFVTAKLMGTDADPRLEVSYQINYPNQKIAYELRIAAKQIQGSSNKVYDFSEQWASVFARASEDYWDETFPKPVYLGGGKFMTFSVVEE